MMRARVASVQDMLKFEADFISRCQQVVRDAITDLASEVISETPIDTSRLVANWQVTMGAPAQTEVSGAWMSPGTGRSSALSGSAAWASSMASARKAAQEYRISHSKVYITNNVDYAYAVEFYGSTAAQKGATTKSGPSMMVRGPSQDWDKMVKRAL